MSGYYNPPPNPSIIGGYAQKVPIYPVNASGLPSTPGHAPQPPSPSITHPAYFGNNMYPSQIPAAAPYGYHQQTPHSNIPHMTAQSSPSSPSSKRPLPSPSGRPASVIYPPQTMLTSSFQSQPVPSGTPLHQRSVTFDPAAYNAMMIIQGQGIGVPNRANIVGFNNTVGPGLRPASVHIPPGWNPSPVGPPAGPSTLSGPGRPKKDADLPPIPPPSNVSPPMTPGSGIVPGSKALPTAPGNQNGVNLNTAVTPGWNQFPPSGPMTPSASSPPEKRPLPAPSHSLPRISTILPNAPQSQPTVNSNGTTPVALGKNSMPISSVDVGGNAAARAPSPSSPTKRALPTAPGKGGIQPGTAPLPTSFPVHPPISTPPPTSTPSSYASVRSVFSTTTSSNAPSTSVSGFTTAPSSFTARPSSYSSASPPPTGAPRSNASDTSSGEVDKRPLWKRMAGAQPSSRPMSVFGHRRGVGSVDAGSGGGDPKPASEPSGSRMGGEVVEQEIEPTTRGRDTQQPNPLTFDPMETQRTPAQQVSARPQGPTTSVNSISSPSLALGHAPLPTPPSNTPKTSISQSTKDAGGNEEKTQASPFPSASKIPTGVKPTPIVPYQPKSRQLNEKRQPAHVTPKYEEPKPQPVLVTPKIPTAAQPTPVVIYQPKPSQSGEPRKSREPQKIKEHHLPPQSIATGSSGGGGKVRFSPHPAQTRVVGPSSQTHTSRSPPRAVAASPPRPSTMKGKGVKSPPREEASDTGTSRIPQSYPHPHSDQQPSSTYQQQRQPHPAPPARTSTAPPAPQISMALRFASMDLQDEARATHQDWAKWALVSSHDVASKPMPLSGAVAPVMPPTNAVPPENVRRKDSGRRRSASTGAPVVSLEDPPPPPVIMVRRGSFDEAATAAAMKASESADTAAMIQAAAMNGGMRRGGARPMPNSGSRGQVHQSPTPPQGGRVHGRSPSAEEPYPQYKPSYTDSEDEESDTNPRITVSTAAPQINVSSPVNVPSINVEGESDTDFPGIVITIDEPEPPTSSGTSVSVINAAPVPRFSFDGPGRDQNADAGSGGGVGSGEKKKKHKKEKSVKEEEDERERARQLARTRPLPPKIKKNSARCGKCDKPILGRIVSAMNARWHPECFRCSVCETFLEHVSSYEHDDRPYCHLDYHELFAPRCFHCKTPIMEEHFITLDDDALGKRTYHEQHFFCAECGDPFLAPKQERKTRQLENGMLEVLDQDDEVGFTVYKGHPYCEACHVRLRMPKCKRCKKSIRPGDQAIEALGGKWCWECFTCNRCSKPFDDPQFYEHDHKPFCQPCYSILLVNQLG